jgi:hypothetical protein
MFGEERLRIYTDDMETPAYDGALSDWVDGSSTEFPPPLAAWHSGALVSYHPVEYASKLRVLLDRLREDFVYYYQIGVNRHAPPNLEREPVASEAVKNEIWLDSAVRLAAYETADIFFRDSAGTIAELTFSASREEVEVLDDVTVRVYWDDSTAPAVDLPLAALFGTGHELSSFETQPMSVRVEERRTMLSWTLPLPFARNARLSLVNGSASGYKLQVRIVGAEMAPEEPFGRMHALRNEQRGPFTQQQRYEAAAVVGEGKFVGAWMFMRGRARADGTGPSSGSFLEGDAVATVDGRTMQGTGLEDYFNAGWYFQDGLYDSEFSALVSLANEARTTRATAVRWHLTDAVEFAKSFDLEFEYGSWEPFIAEEYASVVFYYLQ